MKYKDCYKCTSRETGCHNNCEIYKEFLRRLDVIKRNRSSIIFLDRRNGTLYGRKR